MSIKSKHGVLEFSAQSRWLLLAISLLVVLSGCDRFFLPKPPQIEDGTYLVHVVSGGETREDITTILLWYTGSEDNVSAVQMANPGVDFSDLKAGQRIVIPSSIVTQTNAMPRRKFALGVDVAPTPRPVSAPDVPQQGKKSDPLEELMRRNEKVSSPTVAPPQALGETTQGNEAAVAPSVNRAPSKNKQGGESRAIESFSEDEIGALPVASPKVKEEVGTSSKSATGTGAIPAQSPEMKNPRPRRQPQPEVFDEE